VSGEQKTFNPAQIRCPINSTPLKSTTQLETFVLTTASVTRGSVAGGEDLLDPNPVVEILEVSQGAVIYAKGNCYVINFCRTTLGVQPIAGSNYSIDYDYYLGRKDIIYATTHEIKRLEEAPGDFSKLPVVPEGTLGLCCVDCPPNSTDITSPISV